MQVSKFIQIAAVKDSSSYSGESLYALDQNGDVWWLDSDPQVNMWKRVTTEREK